MQAAIHAYTHTCMYTCRCNTIGEGSPDEVIVVSKQIAPRCPTSVPVTFSIMSSRGLHFLTYSMTHCHVLPEVPVPVSKHSAYSSLVVLQLLTLLHDVPATRISMSCGTSSRRPLACNAADN